MHFQGVRVFEPNACSVSLLTLDVTIFSEYASHISCSLLLEIRDYQYAATHALRFLFRKEPPLLPCTFRNTEFSLFSALNNALYTALEVAFVFDGVFFVALLCLRHCRLSHTLEYGIFLSLALLYSSCSRPFGMSQGRLPTAYMLFMNPNRVQISRYHCKVFRLKVRFPASTCQKED